MKIGHFRHFDAATAPGKRFWLENGELQKQTIGAFIRSEYKTLQLESLADVKTLLERMDHTEHLTSGIAAVDHAVALPAFALAKMEAANVFTDEETGLPLVSRSDADLSRPAGQPGVMVIDSDGGDQDISAALVLTELEDAQPGIDKFASVQCTSSSSLVKWDGGSKEVSGIHTFYHVADVSDVSRSLEALHVRLVIAGHGKHKLSASGAFLPRSSADQALRPASQPIYARAFCGEGITQKKAVKLNSGVELMDTRKAIPPLTNAERGAYAQALHASRIEMQPEMDRVSAEYLQGRAAELATREGISITSATAIIEASREIDTLAGEFVIHTKLGRVTVNEILDNPTEWHSKTCRDPEDPSNTSPTAAKIYCDQDNPLIHSFAHAGGQKGRIYRLVRTISADDEARIEKAKLSKAAGNNAVSVAILIDGITDVATDQAAIEAWALASFCETGETELILVDGFGLIRKTETGHERVVAPFGDFAKWLKTADARVKNEWETVLPACIDLRAADSDIIVDGVWRSISWAKKPQIAEVLDSWDIRRPRLSTSIEVSFEGDADEIEGHKALQDARRGSALLKRCAHIARNPLGELETALDTIGVVGERRITRFTYLTAASSHFQRPVSAIVRAQSSSGKSFTTKSVLNLFPESIVFTVTNISPKALYYKENGFFMHRVVYVEEGEMFVRSGGEKNDVAETFRVLVSEGRIDHEVTVRDPETGRSVSEHIRQDGPISLITTTVRPYLDEELETRMLSVWADESKEQTAAIMRSIAEAAEADIERSVDTDAWHAFAEWIRLGSRRVVVPFATIISDEMTSSAVRARRDISSVLSLVKASALVNRLNRDQTESGAIIADPDDYAVAVDILDYALRETSDAYSEQAIEFVKKLWEFISQRTAAFRGLTDTSKIIKYKDARSARVRQATPTAATTDEKAMLVEFRHGEFADKEPLLLSMIVSGAIRPVAAALGYDQSTYRRRLTHCINAGLVDDFATTTRASRNAMKMLSLTDEGLRVAIEGSDSSTGILSVERLRDLIDARNSHPMTEAAE